MYTRLFFCFLLSFTYVLLSTQDIYANYKAKYTQPAWDHTLDFPAIEARLQDQKIVQLIPMRDYLHKNYLSVRFKHEVYVAILADGLKAVFKPEQTLMGAYAEVAAYRASTWLGLRLVPPTVLKKYKNQQGSLQFLIEPSTINDPQGSKLSSKTRSDIMLFYFIFGQLDAGAKHQLIQVNQGKAYCGLIDNATMIYKHKVMYGDFPFMCIGCYKSKPQTCNSSGPFPFDQQKNLYNPTLKALREAFGRLIPEKMVQYLASKQYNPLTYCIWHDALWVKKTRTENKQVGPNYTTTYYKSTLDQYKKLTKKVLEEIWAEALHANTCYTNDIIDLILERRDQVLKAARTSRIL